MFAIRMKNTDYWCPKRQISYFISDDNSIAFKTMNRDPRDWTEENPMPCSAKWKAKHFGKPEKFRKVWESTDSMRHSLQHIVDKNETYSQYEVINLVTNKVYTLEDVFNKVI